MRNIRRESVDKIKAAEKDKDIGKDDSKGFQVRTCTYTLLFFSLISFYFLGGGAFGLFIAYKCTLLYVTQ